MRLVVFGAGYVGLVTGTCLAEVGHQVLCVDVDLERVQKLRDGVIPIYEPGLSDLARRNCRAGRLLFDTSVEAPFDESDVYIVAVCTPAGHRGAADVSAVHAVAHQVAQLARRPALLVMKSTVPVGTCDAVQARVSPLARVALEVVSNPEFLREGTAVHDFFHPDRIVMGGRTERACAVLRELYEPLRLSEEDVLVTDTRSSELTKYAANAMLALRISFMNEISRVCHATGANVHAVRLGVGSDGRIGHRFLYAGPGYGGSCFPKDVRALFFLGRAHGLPMRLTEAIHLVNEEQTRFLAGLVRDALGSVEGRTVALWGLAFKPNTDDVREAPSIKVARALVEDGANVVGHDPEAGRNFATAMAEYGKSVTVVDRYYDSLDGAHALVLLTEWPCYHAPNFVEIRRRLVAGSDGEGPVVVDARNVWRPHDAVRVGLRYRGVGVPGHTDHPGYAGARTVHPRTEDEEPGNTQAR